MSFTTVLLPILAALSGAENFIGLSPNWLAINQNTKKAFSLFTKQRGTI